MPTIETARLRLRRLRPDDAEAYYQAVLSDADVMRYLPGSVPQPRERTESYYFVRFAEHWDQHGFGLWGVEHKADGRLIGHCGLMTVPDAEDVEIAYSLAKPYWGQGLAPEGARATLRYGFETLGMEQIIGLAVPENTASLRVMIKVGMTSQGLTSQYHGMELAWCTITRDEFDPGDAPYTLSQDD